MKRIYCDGIFDLFHRGHLLHLKKIHSHFDEEIHLIVGVISDKVATSYKRKPFFNEDKRKRILQSCVYSTEVFVTDVLVVDQTFLDEHAIDYVIHAFNDDSDKSKQYEFFQVPIDLGKFIEIKYNDGISTTQIIKDNNLNWNEIWIKKGSEDITDLYVLNGWENSNFNPEHAIDHVVDTLHIKKGSRILEVGCGAGLLAHYLKKYECEYIGIDYSMPLVSKHITILDTIALHFRSDEYLFKSEYFDYVIVNSMLEYLDDHNEVQKTIDQIERVSKKGVYIGNIRHTTREQKLDKHKYNGVFTHTVIPQEYFMNRNYVIIENDDPHRYDVMKLK